MSELRDRILEGVASDNAQVDIDSAEPLERPTAKLDVASVLDALNAAETAVRLARSLLTAGDGPSEDADGRCLHPATERGQAGTFSNTQEFCRRCGDFLP